MAVTLGSQRDAEIPLKYLPPVPEDRRCRPRSTAETTQRAEARRLLEMYLKAKLTPEDPPLDQARKLLAQLPPAPTKK